MRHKKRIINICKITIPSHTDKKRRGIPLPRFVFHYTSMTCWQELSFTKVKNKRLALLANRLRCSLMALVATIAYSG